MIQVIRAGLRHRMAYFCPQSSDRYGHIIVPNIAQGDKISKD